MRVTQANPEMGPLEGSTAYTAPPNIPSTQRTAHTRTQASFALKEGSRRRYKNSRGYQKAFVLIIPEEVESLIRIMYHRHAQARDALDIKHT